jgi:rhamnosyltransferase
MSNSVLALIVSFNGVEELRKTVTALIDQVEKIVVLDNGSDIETLKCIAELEAEFGISACYLGANFGIGAALNHGIAIAKAENFHWILSMDQDSVATPQMISRMLIVGKKYEDAAAVCPSVMLGKTDKIFPGDVVVDCAITSGNLVPMSILADIGGYNESYFIDSVDFEFSLRLRNAGYKIIKCGESGLQHKLGFVVNVDIMGYEYSYTLHSPLRRYYIYRNHMYLLSGFLLKNPVFITKKTIMLLLNFVEILIFDPERKENCKMITRGLLDYFHGKNGVFQ